jgi:hypothetical protein
MASVPYDYESRIVEKLVLCCKNDQTESFSTERIAMNRDFWPKSAKISGKIAKLDDFIAIERTIIGLLKRDLIVDFDAILTTWVYEEWTDNTLEESHLYIRITNPG